jgi:DNA-directed RNA polymerase specialized sigma24 family protein
VAALLLREACGLTWTAVADELGCDLSTIREWRGRVTEEDMGDVEIIRGRLLDA